MPQTTQYPRFPRWEYWKPVPPSPPPPPAPDAPPPDREWPRPLPPKTSTKRNTRTDF